MLNRLKKVVKRLPLIQTLRAVKHTGHNPGSSSVALPAADDRKGLPFVTEASGSSVLIVKGDASLQLRISSKSEAAEKVLLTLQGKNLYTGEYDKGYLKVGETKLHATNSTKHRTTKWFPVLADQGKSLILSGSAHNRSVWQFMTEDKTIITNGGANIKYKVATDVVQDRTFAKVDIPENALYARVYYACFDDQDDLDNRMQIEYGKIPTSYVPYETRQVELPAFGQDTLITYENLTWSVITKNKKEALELELQPLLAGYTLTVDSDTCRIQAKWSKPQEEVIRTGVYGVRWNIHDSNPVCERVGDAKDLHFNCVEGNNYLTPYPNDFDYIYPWSDMKLCAVRIKKNGKRKVTYSNEEGFSLDGKAGNVMVEIPRFYCKREVIDDYEYLWISATEQEGFELDPSFVTKEKVLKRIFVAAYLSRIRKHKLISVSQSYPLIKKSLQKLHPLVHNTNGFAECDLLSILTLQRLYLVETALLDSQSLFPGNVNLPYLLKDKSTSYYAIQSEQGANRIIVEKTALTNKFRVGDAVSVLSSWKEYKNKPMIFQRDITEISEYGVDALEIKFTGEPIDIIKGEIGITCLPCKNGETDDLPCSTGVISGSSGHASFKYRGVENLWGNVSILLDHAYVKNSELYVTYPTGETVKVGYKLPIQPVQLSLKQFGDPANMIVKRMGYDQEHPLIMLPSEIGNGASSSSYYCDAWYSSAEKDVTYILTYGGAWDNRSYAGVFNFRATFTDTQSIPYNGSRIMMR